MAALLPYRAYDVFNPVTGGGAARGAAMPDAQQWGISIEKLLTSGRFGVSSISDMAALPKASLKDGDTLFVDVPGIGGVFRWDASSTVTADGGIYIASDEGGTGRWVRLYDGDTWWLEWWGAKTGVNAADADTNSDALDAALGAWLASTTVATRKIGTGPGRWWFSRSHDVGSDFTYQNLTLWGPGHKLCSWETTLSGAGSVFIKNDAVRNNSLYIEGIQFITRNAAGTVCPILVEDLLFQEGQWVDVAFTQGSQDQISNTLWVTSGWWNADAVRCHSYGGGHFKSVGTALTTTVRFGLTTGDNTVTATEPVFSTASPGDLWYFGESGGAWVGEIDTVAPDGLSVEMTKPAPYTKESEYGWADGVRCTTTATNDTITLNAAVAVESDIGRYIGILGAGTVRGRTSVHVAKIIGVPSPSSYQLDRPPTQSVTGERLYISPACLILYDPSDPFNNTTNDMDLSNIRIDYFRGCGLLIEDAIDINGRNLKIHGAGSVGQGYKPDLISQAHAIIGSRSCFIEQGNTEGSCFDTGRIILTGTDQAAFNGFSGLRMNGQAIIWSREPVGANATVKLGDVVLYNQQYDIDADGNGLPASGFVPMLAGPVPSGSVNSQTLNHWGETVLSNGLNKRLMHGRGGAILAQHSVMGERQLYIGQNTSKKILLPRVTLRQNGTTFCFRIQIKTYSNDHADIGVLMNTSSTRNVKLVVGDTNVWAVSNDVGPQQTTGKITVSVDNDGFLHIDNRVANAYFDFHIS